MAKLTTDQMLEIATDAGMGRPSRLKSPEAKKARAAADAFAERVGDAGGTVFIPNEPPDLGDVVGEPESEGGSEGEEDDEPAANKWHDPKTAFKPEDGHWVTIEHEHVFIRGGRITKGPADLVGKKPEALPDRKEEEEEAGDGWTKDPDGSMSSKGDYAVMHTADGKHHAYHKNAKGYYVSLGTYDSPHLAKDAAAAHEAGHKPPDGWEERPHAALGTPEYHKGDYTVSPHPIKGKGYFLFHGSKIVSRHDTADEAKAASVEHARVVEARRAEAEKKNDLARFKLGAPSGGAPATGDADAHRRTLSHPMPEIKPDPEFVGERQKSHRSFVPDVDEKGKKTEAHLKKVMARAKPFIQVRHSALEKIADTGRFMSQFETKTSGGMLAPETRAHAERKQFGYARDMDPKQRPIYGYVHNHPLPSHPSADAKGYDAGRYSSVENYGNVAVELHPHVKDRTTFTVGDSLGLQQVPSPVKNPSYLSATPSGHRDFHEGRGRGLGFHTNNYHEAQYHGGVSTRDIKAVHVGKNNDPSIKQRMKKLAETHGWEYHEV